MLSKNQKKLANEYLTDPVVSKVAYKAAASFSKELNKHEIDNCVTAAVFRAITKFDEDRGAKFSSYLYRGVIFECLTQRKAAKRGYIATTVRGHFEDPVDHFESIDMIDTIQEKCHDPDLVIDRFYLNLTYKELANKHGVVEETIRQRLKKNLIILQSVLN